MDKWEEAIQLDTACEDLTNAMENNEAAKNKFNNFINKDFE